MPQDSDLQGTIRPDVGNQLVRPAAAAKLDMIANVEGLTKVYHMGGALVEVQALRGINLAFEQGEYIAITGPSGSGKSTLMNILGCLDRLTTGRYVLGGQDVSELGDNALSEIRSRRVGFVFQNFNLIPQLTVIENIEVPLFYQGMHARDRRARAIELAEALGLGDRLSHRPMELSGGQQQRVAIGRAMINDPLIILADEPTGNLDTKTGEMILGVFDQLHEAGKTLVMVTHESVVAERCSRVIALRDGLVVADDRNARR